MRNNSINRRSFLKMAGAVGAAGGAGVFGLPSPLKASKEQMASRDSKFTTYDRGVHTQNFCEMCFWNCGVNVYTRNGRVHKLEGNKLNPNNSGKLCAKGNAGIVSTYDPDRIQSPMIRTGKRGEGKWKKVSWEEAYEYVYQKLNPIIEKNGPQSLATFMHGTGERYVHTLTLALGSPNITVPAYSQCMGSREMGFALTFGSGLSGHEPFDMRNTKHMMIFGRNYAGSIQVGEAKAFADGLARGAKLTYVDPRLSESGAHAHNWLQVNPGTDQALLLALIHVIIRDNLANMDFVRKYCYGYNELREHIKQYTPSWAEKKCGIKAKKIEEVAWDFAKDAPNVMAVPPRRMTRYGNDTQMARSVAILNALMGSWGVPGGIWVRNDIPLDLGKEEHPPHPKARRADGAGANEKYIFAPDSLGRTNGIYEATRTQEPYPIKAWLLYGTNPIGHSAVGENKMFEILDKLEFIVAIDTQMSDTAFYSDIVLPESTYLERDDAPFIQKDAVPFIALRKAAIKPIYDTKGCFYIAQGIAKKFGVGKYFEKNPTQMIEELFEHLSEEQANTLKTDGVLRFDDADAFPGASGGKMEFLTSTSKVQLYVPDLEELYKKHGDEFNPLPVYSDPVMAKSGEFRLLFGRTPHHSHARTQNNWLLLELQDDTPIWIHPKDAKKLGLKDGDKVTMSSKKTGYTSHPEVIKITKRIKEGNLFIHHGFGHITKAWSRGYNKGLSEQYFISDGVDPISGAGAFHNGFVTIKKV